MENVTGAVWKMWTCKYCPIFSLPSAICCSSIYCVTSMFSGFPHQLSLRFPVFPASIHLPHPFNSLVITVMVSVSSSWALQPWNCGRLDNMAPLSCKNLHFQCYHPLHTRSFCCVLYASEPHCSAPNSSDRTPSSPSYINKMSFCVLFPHLFLIATVTTVTTEATLTSHQHCCKRPNRSLLLSSEARVLIILKQDVLPATLWCEIL